MPVEAYMRTLPGGRLVPDSDWDAESLEHLRPGEVVRAQVTRPRNPRFHRLFFAMLRTCYEFEQVSDRYPSVEHFRRAALIAAGHCEWWPGIHPETGEPMEFVEPRSIAWGKCDETEFRRIYSDVLDAILQNWLTGISEAEINRQVEAMLGFM